MRSAWNRPHRREIVPVLLDRVQPVHEVVSVDLVPLRKEITVPRNILQQYTGTYELQPGFDLVVTLEGDQLMTQATGQGKNQLFAESETKFFLKVVDAEVEFIKDDKGVVTHMVLYQGGREMKAPRK